MVTITIGFVGNEKVTAYTYGGMDSGFNHYIWKGKTYTGNVKFDVIDKVITNEY